MSGTQAYTHLSSATPAPGALAIPTLPAFHARMRPGTPEHRVGIERLGIEEQVVDATVDHVDPLEPLHRLHVDAFVVADDQVGALDQLGAHPLSEERVLEVRRVEDARREHHEVRVASTVRRERHEQLVEFVGVAVDGPDQVALEQLGKGALRDDPVLEHVADARRDAQIVLEHVELAVARPDEIGPRDVRPHPELRMDAAALLAEVRRSRRAVRRGRSPRR